MEGLQAIVDFILGYAVTLAALGALTVALIEAYKKLFSTLPKFHQSALQRWLQQQEPRPAGSDSVLMPDVKFGGHYGVAETTQATPKTEQGPPYDWRSAYGELLHLTTGLALGSARPESKDAGAGYSRNISYALFELELARMMSQLQEAADAGLNNPRRYRHWFEFLTRGCDKLDVARWVEAFAGASPMAGLQQREREELAELYGRLRLLVRRQLDSFQTVTAYRWREWNQFWAWALGAVLLLAAQWIQALQAGAQQTLATFGWMVLVSLAGGILAPVAKDLVDALASFKAR